MEGSLPAKEAENSEVTISTFVVMTNFIIFMTLPYFLLLLDTQDLPTVVRNSDEMDTMNSDEVHRDTAATLPESKPSHESCTTVSDVIRILLLCRICMWYVCYQKRILVPQLTSYFPSCATVRMGHICLSEVQLWRVPSCFAQRVDKERCCKCWANCASQGIFRRFKLSVLCILGELWHCQLCRMMLLS
jgi:ribosomal protein S14